MKKSAPKKRSRPSRNAADRRKSKNSAGLDWRPGRRPLKVWPPDEAEKRRANVGEPIVLGDWSYRTVRSTSPRESGVPWELIVEPAGLDAASWQGGSFAVTPQVRGGIGDVLVHHERRKPLATDDYPIVELPESVWRQRMDADLQDVVGIHFHEYVSNDVARILYTLHKVPADDTPGYEGKRGTRIEATLLTPVVWSLDQSIAVRVDNEVTPDKAIRKQQTEYRVAHERGHADVSIGVPLDVIRGPQTWNLAVCEGRHSRIAYFWKRELVGRAWDGYQHGAGKLATLRTTIAIVPPTRWSMLLPIPPSRVTSKHLQDFNDSIVLLGPQFNAADRAAQEEFHSHHGEYDAGP